MNAQISKQKKLKDKYGVTFTDNMSLKEILEAWGRIAPSVLSTLSPALGTIMSAAQVTYNAATSARSVYAPIKSTYEEAKVMLDDVTSAVYTSGAVTAAKVADIAGKETEEIASKAEQEGSAMVLSVLESFA